jgi:hypothetical protein
MDRFNAGRTVNFLRILRGTANLLLVSKGGRFNARSKSLIKTGNNTGISVGTVRVE